MESLIILKQLVLIFVTGLVKTSYTGGVKDSTNKNLPCDNKAADVVFLLDTSTSVWDEDFDKQVVFVKHIVNNLPIGEHSVRVAVSSFGSDVFTHFYLNSFYDKNNLLDAISDIQYHGGGTNTGSAIRHARTILHSEKHGGRSDVDKIVIVVTDGYSSDAHETANEASMSRSLGIKLISIGIGHGIEEFELRHIASTHNGKKLVFTVDTFDSLFDIEDVITTTTCEVIQTNVMSDASFIENPTESEVRKYCGGKPADVYFVVDSSSSVLPADYQKMLHFVSDVIDLFDVGPKKTRVGVVAFSDGIHPVIGLDNDYNCHTLKHRVKSIKHYTGGTQTGSALRYIREHGLKRGYARQNVAHVVILLTDGMSADAKLTISESRMLKQMGTYVFAVGIGDQVDTHELQTISSQPREEFVFLMEDFHVLSAIKNVLAIKTCLGTVHTFPANDQGTKIPQADTDSAVCKLDVPLDVIYVFDSQAVGDEHSGIIEKFIADVVISTTGSGINSGLMTHACSSNTGVPLAAYKDWSEIKPLLRQSQAEGVANILKQVRVNGFTEQNGGRQEAKKKVVLFIDGNIKDEDREMQLAVKRLKFRSDVELTVVFIGKQVHEVISSLVDSHVDGSLLHVSSVHKLHSIKHSLIEHFCRVKL